MTILHRKINYFLPVICLQINYQVLHLNMNHLLMYQHVSNNIHVQEMMILHLESKIAINRSLQVLKIA